MIIEALRNRGGSKLILASTALALVGFGVLVTTQVQEAWWGDFREGYHPLLDGWLGSCLLLAATVPIAWIAGRVMPTLVRIPWLAAGLGVICLILPLLWGEVHFAGEIRVSHSIGLRGYGIDPSHWHWVPGYLGLLLLLAVMVVLAERLRATRLVRYALGHALLLWLGVMLLLRQADFALTLLLFAGALATAVLARPRGLSLLILVVSLVLVPRWAWIEGTETWRDRNRGSCLTFTDPGYDTQTLRGAAWKTAGWWGFPPVPAVPEDPAQQASLSNLATLPYWHPDYRLPLGAEGVLNAAVQLYGWVAAGAVMLAATLHLGALFRLVGRRRNDREPLWLWLGWVYAGITTLSAALSTVVAVGWIGEPFPSFVYPWLSGASDHSALYAQAWLTGTVLAPAAGPSSRWMR